LQKDAEEPPLSVHIVIGLFRGHGRHAQELLEAADRQLYQRKKVRKAGAVDAAAIAPLRRGSIGRRLC
jgi:hypothetical protein